MRSLVSICHQQRRARARSTWIIPYRMLGENLIIALEFELWASDVIWCVCVRIVGEVLPHPYPPSWLPHQPKVSLSNFYYTQQFLSEHGCSYLCFAAVPPCRVSPLLLSRCLLLFSVCPRMPGHWNILDWFLPAFCMCCPYSWGEAPPSHLQK